LDPSVFLGLGFLGLGLGFLGLGLGFLGLGLGFLGLELGFLGLGLGFLGLELGFLGLGLGFLGLGLVLIGLVGLVGLAGLAGLVLVWGSSPPNTAIWSVYCVSGNSNTQKNVSTYFRSFIYCYSLYIYLNLFLYGDKLININSNCELRLICFKINAPHRDRTCDLVVNSDALSTN
jgi:hypothetical protein